MVEIMESRPHSKTKHWLLVKVVKKVPTGSAEDKATIAATTETPS
jgi:hypothetical protein